MAKTHVRLDKDVATVIRKAAKRNSRSLAWWTNHTLRGMIGRKGAK
jgi:hypothetical protein